MRQIVGFPPNYAHIRARFGQVVMSPGVIFSYGDIIYTPKPMKISPALIVHEEVHGERQRAIGVKVWWARYLADDDFRWDEELAAHRAEYRFWTEREPDKYKLEAHLTQIASRLAGPLYGKMKSRSEAVALIAGVK